MEVRIPPTKAAKASQLLLFVLTLALPSLLLSDTVAESVYRKVAPSVFLIEVRGAGGETVGQATAFVIDRKHLVTNAHVTAAGRPFVVAGGLVLECRVAAVDDANDLALLELSAEISAPSLKISDQAPAPGVTVYAIGNPSGFEKTISTGLSAGIREADGQQFLQISAPVSPGSSGGPVVDAEGEVVGVVSLSLRGAQNLNLAIPSAALKTLLAGKTPPLGFERAFAQLERLENEQAELEYSGDVGSPWQSKQEEIDALLAKTEQVLPADPHLQVRLASAANYNDTEIAVRAARRALLSAKKLSTAELFSVAEVLYATTLFETDETKKSGLFQDAMLAASTAETRSGGLTCEQQETVGDIESGVGKRAQAVARWKKMLVSCPEFLANTLWSLCWDAIAHDVRADVTSYFARLEKVKTPTVFQYKTYAEYLQGAGEYRAAADAFLTAAAAAPDATTGFSPLCSAASNYWRAGETDSHIRTARLCLDLSAQVQDENETIARAHRLLADSLIDRGVYDDAIAHAKSAIAIANDDAWAYYELSLALDAVDRDVEAAEAAKTAIRLSDGKHATMHFALGSAYFDLENWAQARQAFMKAAQLNTSDSAAAYNIALCFQREGYSRDAATWYEEVLRRRPNHPDREDIKATIAKLRRR